jgi:hypothetical protein
LVYKLREGRTLYLSMFVLSFLVFLPTIDGSAAVLYPYVSSQPCSSRAHPGGAE